MPPGRRRGTEAANRRWRLGDSASKATFLVEDPATGLELCVVTDATPADAAAALTAAADAQPPFATLPPREQGGILRRAFEIIVDRVSGSRSHGRSCGYSVVIACSDIPMYEQRVVRSFIFEMGRFGKEPRYVVDA